MYVQMYCVNFVSENQQINVYAVNCMCKQANLSTYL